MAIATAKKIEYTVGCDPELFIVDGEGSPISAHDILPGNKIVPHHVPHGAVQVDGTAAEFNIQPARGSAQFSSNITSVLKMMSQMVKIDHPDFQLRAMPVARFKPDYFETLPAEALMFGCEPDFQAWDSGNIQKFSGTVKPMRTGGGHIHIGWTQDELAFDQAHFYDCIQATKQMDSSLFLASLLWDSNQERRQVYGKMGSFRPKPYGVEYRPLSNVWVGDIRLHVFIFRTVDWAMKLLDTDGVELWDSDELVDIIPLLRSDHHISRNDLIDLHLSMNKKFGMPKLPEKYLVKDYSRNTPPVLAASYPRDPLGGVSPEQAAKAILGA